MTKLDLMPNIHFRNMIASLNPQYRAPNRDTLANELIPSWYRVEKERLKQQLKEPAYAGITSDGWTSLAQDHYITVTVHFIVNWVLFSKVLQTKAVYTSQTGIVVADEIGQITREFAVFEKLVALTVDNAANMNIAAEVLTLLKIGCFAHTLNVAAQKLYGKDKKLTPFNNWVSPIRTIVVWFKRVHLAKVILK